MKFGLFTHNGALNSKPVFEAFANGVAHLGHEVVYNDINADVAVIGVSGTGEISPPNIWGIIIPGQTTNWSAVADSQDPTWSPVSDSQDPNWEEVA